MKHDMLKEREYAESERRRAEQDRKRAFAQANPTSSHIFNKSLGGVGTHAAIVIKLMHKDKSTLSFMTCELSADGDNGELALIVVCPSCLFRHGRRMGDCQMTIRSTNRAFSLDQFGQGELWVNPENRSEVVTLAGTIETHGPVKCPVCHFKFELEKSHSPSEKGITLLREV